MGERFDAVVLGMGPGGEVAAGRLLDGGMKVAVVERELIGGECAYWACIPSKTLIRIAEVRAQAGRTAGTRPPDLDWPEVVGYRDTMIRHLDDAAQVRGYEERGATVVKGTGRLLGPGTVEAGGRKLSADHVVLATGSDTEIPPVQGLREVPFWTNREATTLSAIPRRAVLLGGGPVGIELGHMLARFGAEVVLVQSGPRLLSREEPRVGELVRAALEADGVDVRAGRRATAARRDGAGVRLDLDDGSTVTAEAVVIATGRKPRLADAIARPWTYERDPRGELKLLADRRRRVLVGAWAVAPLAGEWIHQAALAIRAEIPIEVLLDTVAQFPTYAEAYLKGLEALDL